MTTRQGELKVGWVNLYSYNLLVGSCYQLLCRAEGAQVAMGPAGRTPAPSDQPGIPGQGLRRRKTLTLAMLGTCSPLPCASHTESLNHKGQAMVGGGHTHWVPSGRHGQDSLCLPSCHSRSPLHLSRHQQPSTLPPGSLSPGWAHQQRACSKAPRSPRSLGHPGVRRTAWMGPDQTSQAQVDASSFVSLETEVDCATTGSKGTPKASSGSEFHPMGAIC